MTVNVVLGILFLIVALVLLAGGAAMVTQKFPGNKYVGLQVPEARESKEIWDAAHKVTGFFVILASLAMAFAASFAFIAQGWVWVFPAVAVVAALASISVGANQGARTARILRANEKAQEQPSSKVDIAALREAANRADSRGNN
ncbi:SdpI family protein [Corynebacterium aquatimens]|uniref:Membrane protein n=1 Tax=Corynebacterium aquatimens TaxID=1190508 RepID=A0A931E357_9CORY|nr:SdpI family protein [Corynebacterium aquatimens]MBG6122740.1 putative membrane protein [Corynebacterium aquatimens]WJY66923.1 hypothetical protein CAQUA_11200 [Corynebacterium aquatimens]